MTEFSRLATTPRTTACIDIVSEVFTATLGRLDSWRDELVLAVDTQSPTRRTIDELVESLVLPSLTMPDTNIIGAGFVSAPGFLPDAYWHLAWWLGEQNTIGFDTGTVAPIRRLETVTDPTSDRFRDYTNLEWWRVPERTGSPHITGPYVDYLCTDEYTLTVTMPVYASSNLIGMIGADSYVKQIEALLLPHLYEVGCGANVVNASGRVVASSDPHHAPGSILRIAGLSEQLHTWSNSGIEHPHQTLLPGGEIVLECPGTNLALVLDGQYA